jgi:parvulin-like peptidyl-prolyl isomerase
MEHRKYMLFRSFVVLIAASASLAMAADVRVVEEIAAKVNGSIVTRGDLEQQRHDLEMMLRQEQHLSGAALAAAVDEQSQNILREKIDELLLIQKAKDMDISVDSDVTRRIAEMRVQSKIDDPDKFDEAIRQQYGMTYEEFKQKMTDQFLIHKVISQEISSRIAIPEADLQKYYDAHKADFLRKAQVFLSQILISTEGKTPEQVANAEAKAKDIVARARRGEKFSDLVAANSDDPDTSKNGGQLPPLLKGQLRPEIEKIVFTEKKGYVTDPIGVTQPQKGFLILRIDERYEEGQASFDEVKEQIQETLAQPMMESKMRPYLTKLREAAFLEIKDGYVDTGAAPGKDTRWHDVAELKPQTVTKEEVAAHAPVPHKKLLGVVPIPGTTRKTTVAEADTSQLGTHNVADTSAGQSAGTPTALPMQPPIASKPPGPAASSMAPIKQ